MDQPQFYTASTPIQLHSDSSTSHHGGADIEAAGILGMELRYQGNIYRVSSLSRYFMLYLKDFGGVVGLHFVGIQLLRTAEFQPAAVFHYIQYNTSGGHFFFMLIRPFKNK